MTKQTNQSLSDEWQSCQLPNGLQIVFESSPTNVVYCGYVVKAGTRHEDADDFGMAHFIEHLTFKGTENRKSYHISNALEQVGGDLNAYTTKQETVFYATVLNKDFARAVDILSDIVFHSTFPQNEIEHEVEVICDEIDSYKDSPSELIFDEFEQNLFPNHPLGRDILGQPERLRSYTTADARRFVDKYYRPSNVVFYVYGNVPFSQVVSRVKAATSDLSGEPVALLPQPLEPFVPSYVERSKHTHQTHVLVGRRTFGGADPRRYALIILNNLLGGPGMNARLNLAMREKAGLVYSVESSLATYPDTGTWNVYFGCDEHDLKRCFRIFNRELQRTISTPLTPTALSRAKKQLIGQIGISCDSFESYSLAMGRVFAHYGTHRDLPKLFSNIQSVTAEDIQSLAAEFFNPDTMSTLLYK